VKAPLYDTFVRRYGLLNDRKNFDLIKMDAGGRETLSLECSLDGKLIKADIFHQPVSFNPLPGVTPTGKSTTFT
jgi:hypothetical protein